MAFNTAVVPHFEMKIDFDDSEISTTFRLILLQIWNESVYITTVKSELEDVIKPDHLRR